MKALLRNLLHRAGYRLSRITPPPDTVDGFGDLTTEEKAIIQSVISLTLTGPERLAALIGAVKHVVQQRIPGDIVECGVWRGGSMALIARTLLLLGETSRTLYLYDTFAGMPAPTDRDRDLLGRAAGDLLGAERRQAGNTIWAYATLDDVRANLLATGYPADHIVFVPGKVEATIPGTAPEAIAVLRLDTDWYVSTRHELQHLYPRLSRHGVLIVDDYGHWRGSRDATDEYLRTLPHPLYLHRVDYTARLAVKP